MATDFCQKCKKAYPVESAITMTKVNAPKRFPSMSLRNQSVRDQRMRMTSERHTDDSAVRKERAHLFCQLKASFVVNEHYSRCYANHPSGFPFGTGL